MNKNSKPLISVVVPIYKVERYLKQCVDSILSQTYRNLEVILVDDGSPDRCPELIDEYAARDARVVAIHQPNGGYGKAVNNGIARATGKYIGIIESDDWIEPNMYETLVKSAEETGAEVTKCRFWYYDSNAMDEKKDRLYNNLSIPHIPKGEVFCPLDYPEIFLYHSSLWSNLYLADFVRPIKVIESAKAAYQDFPFIMEVLGRAKRFVFIDEPFVHYRMEEGQGSSCTRNDARLIQSPIIKYKGLEILEHLKVFDSVCEEFFYHVFKANQKYLAKIQLRYAQEFFFHFQKLMKRVQDYPQLTFKYFNKADCRYLNKLLKRRSVSFTRPRWKFSISKRRVVICLNGNIRVYSMPWSKKK